MPGVADASRTRAGRYSLDGWTATYHDDDGRVTRVLFYRFPDSDDVIGLGASLYYRSRSRRLHLSESE